MTAAEWIALNIVGNDVKGFDPLPRSERPEICKAMVEDPLMGWPDMVAAQNTLDEWEWT